MIRIVTTVNGRRTLFLGLDRNNTTQLHDGHPAPVDVEALGRTAGPIQDVILCAGETLKDIHAELSEHLPLPPYQEPSP